MVMSCHNTRLPREIRNAYARKHPHTSGALVPTSTTPRRQLVPALALLSLLASACGTPTDSTAEITATVDTIPLAELPSLPPPVEAGKLLLSGAATVIGSEEGNPHLTVQATATNTTAEPIALQGLCIAQIHAFREGDSAHNPAWAAPAQPHSSCPSPQGQREISPAAKFWLRAAGEFTHPRVSEVLEAAGSDGRYTIDLIVRIGDELVTVPAGTVTLSSDSRPPLRDPALLRYAIKTQVEGEAPPMLATHVVAVNPTDRPIYLEYGSCALRLRAYRNADRRGAPVWRSEYRRRPGESFGYVCLGYLATAWVQPGEAISPPEFHTRIPLYEILGDSLPDGDYHFTADLEFQNGSGASLEHQAVTFAAGSAELSSRVEPLPQERDVDGIRYRAEVGTDAQGKSHLTLSLTNLRAERTLLLGSRSTTCSSQLLGYRSSDRRDRWYLENSADWVHIGCLLRIPPTWLAPGETQSFTASLHLAGAEDASDLHHLVLHLWLDREPEGEAGRLTLSAGEVALPRR